MDQLPLWSRFMVRLRLSGPATLPALPGSELRGMLSQGLNLVGAGHPSQQQGPAPFVMVPGWLDRSRAPDKLVSLAAGSEVVAHVLGFGPGARRLAEVSAALAAVGQRPWLGRKEQRTSFTVAVESLVEPGQEGAEPYCAASLWAVGQAEPLFSSLRSRVRYLATFETLALTTNTPLALRVGSHVAESLADARPLVRSLCTRISRLAADHGAADATIPPWNGEPLNVIQDDTRFVRFSRQGRGGRKQPLLGLSGSVALQTPGEALLWRLVLGEQLLVGRWTAFGLGQYRLTGANKMLPCRP